MPKIITYKHLLLKQNVLHDNSVQFVIVSIEKVVLINYQISSKLTCRNKIQRYRSRQKTELLLFTNLSKPEFPCPYMARSGLDVSICLSICRLSIPNTSLTSLMNLMRGIYIASSELFSGIIKL